MHRERVCGVEKRNRERSWMFGRAIADLKGGISAAG